MSERDQRRQLAVGAGISPTDPGGHPQPRTSVHGDVDVVQAVAALVSDLVDGTVDGERPNRDDEPAPGAVDAEQEDLAEGPEGARGEAVAPGPDRGGQAVGPTAS